MTGTDRALTGSGALPDGKITTPVVISVIVNTVPKGDLFAELDDEGKVFLRADDFRALNLKFSDARIVLIHGEQYLPADAVLEATPAFDDKKLILSFIGKTTEAHRTTAEIFQLHAKPQSVYYPRETSAFLNYGLTYGETNPFGYTSFSATSKVGARTGDTFFVSDSLYSKTEVDQKFVRLHSSVTYEHRNDLQWLTMGDQFARSGELGSSVNLGGIGFSKVYKIDPYFITQPVFGLQGSVIYPTQAEIYLDGILVGRQQIAPGTFDLKNIYSYTGSHQVEVVLKDPFGKEQRITSPVYFNTFMLRQGLHEYSYNIGYVREQYGMESNEYGEPAFIAFHRYGVTNALNIGAQAEGSNGVYNGGISTSFLLSRIGAFSLSYAASTASGEKGSAASFQHTYQFGTFSTNLRARSFSRNYATVAAPASTAQEQTKQESGAGAGFLLLPVGSISLNYSERESYSGDTTRILSAHYSRTLTRMVSLFATASETRQAERVRSFFVGLNFNFDNHLYGATQYTKTGDMNMQTAQIQKDVPVGEGFGYRATASRTEVNGMTSNSLNPHAQYNGPYGIYSVDVNAQRSAGGSQQIYSVTAAGALVYAGGFSGLSRPVSDSFSIVMLDNVAGATVLNNSQEIGTTDASGKVIVPTITSYGQNMITADVRNLPMEYSISGMNRALSPSLWSGSCLAFEAVKMQAVTGNLFAVKDSRRTPMEYVEISINAAGRTLTFPTGKNGEFYIENTIPKDMAAGDDQQSCSAIAERKKTGGRVITPGVYPASIDLDGSACLFQITFPDTADVITELGEIQCELKKDIPQAVPEPQAVQMPALVAVAPPAHQSALQAPFREVTVGIRFDRTGNLERQQDRRALAALAKELEKNPTLAVAIEVHGDRQGTERDQQRTGARAADQIRRALIQAGVRSERIGAVENRGRSKMLCSEETAECDRMNRRAVIRLVGESSAR
ncbi:MAG: fimbria/pilus outer membrane usher protein [Nitrospirota bacterium]|nr:fimbria/pilus outer membrane usher protein [Nitrospirota bacterium]